jgi:hypothetical protein
MPEKPAQYSIRPLAIADQHDTPAVPSPVSRESANGCTGGQDGNYRGKPEDGRRL